MSAALKFVILTDTHFVPRGRHLYGLDPRERLGAAVALVNRDHPDIDFLIVTGDLAHWGERAAYESLREILGALRAPVVTMMGNHDLRGPFREVFPEADDDGKGFVQSVRRHSAATVVTLDTLNEGGESSAGRLCGRRLAFLREALESAPADLPLILFQHHPPFDVGLPHMDRIRLDPADSEAELALFRGTGRKPDYLFMGHVHRPISGVWEGIPFQIQRALGHQVGFDFKNFENVPGTLETPDYSLVTVGGGRITVHQRQFLYDGPAFTLQDPQAAAAASLDALATR